jgi:hypothetical protein
VADFIGANVSNSLRVSELSTGHANISAYAGYHAGKLAKVALTNQLLWLSSSGKPRPSDSIQLKLPGVTAKEVIVRKLTGPSGDSLTNITFAGLDWPYSNQGMEVLVQNNTATVSIEDGVFNIAIQATEALLISW